MSIVQRGIFDKLSDKTIGFGTWRRSRRAIAISLAIAYSLASASVASAVVVCSKNIASCGCSITSQGVYLVTNSTMTSAANSDCISVGAKNVVLNLNGATFTGPGSGSIGAAVHIKPAGSSIFVEGQGLGSSPALLSGWKYGIEDDGSDALMQDFSAKNNFKAGVFFFKAKSSEVVNFEASNNTGYGVWVSSGNNNDVGTGIVSSNTLDGVLVGCAGTSPHCTSGGGNTMSSTVFSMTANTNGAGGITVQFNSNNNQIGKNSATGNTTGDLLDNHATGCANNMWFANTSGSATKGCIH